MYFITFCIQNHHYIHSILFLSKYLMQSNLINFKQTEIQGYLHKYRTNQTKNCRK